MSETEGTYYDGRTSAGHRVTISFEPGTVRIRGQGIDVGYPSGEVEASPKIGSLRRGLRFADGALCELADDAALDRWLGRAGRGGAQTLLHRLETRLRFVVIALLLAVAGVAVLAGWGIPWAARRVAFSLPPATQRSLGLRTMEILDRIAFAPSGLPADRREEVSRLFRRMAAELPDGGSYRLEFRSGRGIGANALALPSGIILVTDEMVRLARHGDEIAAVLAHEIGHIRHRHALRHALQTSVALLLVATVAGDVASATSLSAALPTALVHAKFSRDFEREADDAAVEWLEGHGIPLSRFADILARLEADRRRKQGRADADGGASVTDYLSTHPLTEERLRRLQPGPASTR